MARLVVCAAVTTSEREMQDKVAQHTVAPFRRRVFGDLLLGFAFGYLVLHPVAMEVVRWLEPGVVARGAGSPPTLATVIQAMAGVLRADMVPMGLIFGALCAVLAGANGAYRLALSARRDQLARQLEATERYRLELEQALGRVRAQNVRLARLEQARRRTTRFMVHDFKTHLGCIIGFSELLMRVPASVPPSEHGDAVRRIHRQGLRMMHAVTDLLDLHRLQEAPQLARGAVSPTELLREAADDLALPAERGRIELGPSHEGCPQVSGDRRLLVRVLSNLAANAVKHNPPGTRAVLDASWDAESRRVLFSCRDDGLGIPAALLETMFGEFRSGSPEGPEASSGVGLAFCKAAVEANGGRIWCETTEGQGASFFFTLPTVELRRETRPGGPKATQPRREPVGARESVDEARRLAVRG